MMRTVLLLALTVAVYSFPKERSIKSISKRAIDEHTRQRRSIDLFDKFDINGDGYLNTDEMADLFFVYGFPAVEAEILGVHQIQMFDLDNDMRLDRWEFTRNEEAGKPFIF